MKILHNLLGLVCAICLIIIILITSVEAAAYWVPGYFEKEYQKYGVASDVDMEMEDLLYVTHEMMSYLKGGRDNLRILTTVAGQERQFFNAREIAHMEDVRALFLGAVALRRICLTAILLSLALLVLLRASLTRVLPRMICAGTGLFVLLSSALAAIISTDFTKYFIVFHKILFDNDLWLLDPSTDLLINIVPEPFFVDISIRIGLFFAAAILVLFTSGLLCLFFHKKASKK